MSQLRCRRCWSRAFKEAENFKDEYVSTEHLLLALARSEGNDPVQTWRWRRWAGRMRRS
jgi:hypothetical protein